MRHSTSSDRMAADILQISQLQNDNGSIALFFALSLLVLCGIVGMTVDNSRIVLAHSQLSQAADAAVLAAAQKSSDDLLAGVSTWTSTGAILGNDYFNARISGFAFATAPTATTSITSTGKVVTATLTYSASIPTIFMGIFGFPTVSVGGSPRASSAAMPYTDLHIVIDNSTSMGIGATIADQSTLMATIGCSLACHISDNYGNTDTLAAARASGATLRIDAMKSAIVSALAMLNSSPVGVGRYRVSIYTMSNSLTTVFPLSNDIAGAIAAVTTIDLTSAQFQGGTDTTYSLDQLAAKLASAGTGATAALPLGLVMLLTDGVQNSISTTNPTGSKQSYAMDPHFIMMPQKLNAAKFATLEAFDPSACAPIKRKNYTMLALNIQYVTPDLAPDKSDPRYVWIAANVIPLIATTMAACATSPDLSLSANSPSEINSAVSELLDLALVRPTRLTY